MIHLCDGVNFDLHFSMNKLTFNTAYHGNTCKNKRPDSKISVRRCRGLKVYKTEIQGNTLNYRNPVSAYLANEELDERITFVRKLPIWRVSAFAGGM